MQRALCDITLRCVDNSAVNDLHAHKAVLAAISPYLAAMFILELAESRQQVWVFIFPEISLVYIGF